MDIKAFLANIEPAEPPPATLSDFCGQWVGRYLNPKTGRYQRWPFYCRHYVDCPICRKLRRDDILDRLRYALNERMYEPVTKGTRPRRIVLQATSLKQAQKIMRGFGQRDTWIIPQRDEKAIVVYDAYPEVVPNFELPTEERVDIIIENGGTGHRFSGNLGKKPREDQGKKEGVPIETMTWYALPPMEGGVSEGQIVADVMSEIGDPDNSSQFALQNSFNLLSSRIRRKLEDAGFTITGERTGKRLVRLADVEWDKLVEVW